MSKRTINWICTVKPGWEWRSGSPGTPGFSVEDDPIREGSITLPPDEDYWYPCVELVLQDTTKGTITGNVYLRYFKEDGVDKIQAITVAQNVWISEGPISTERSETNCEGGINLHVYF
jgi:hypothetical protein